MTSIAFKLSFLSTFKLVFYYCGYNYKIGGDNSYFSLLSFQASKEKGKKVQITNPKCFEINAFWVTHMHFIYENEIVWWDLLKRQPFNKATGSSERFSFYCFCFFVIIRVKLFSEQYNYENLVSYDVNKCSFLSVRFCRWNSTNKKV